MTSFRIFKMNTLVLSAVCSLISVFSAFSQSETDRKPSIAVVPFAESGRASYGGPEVTELLTNELINSHRFSVTEKAKSKAIEPELLSAVKDTVDKSTAAAIGQKVGATVLLLGNLTEYGEKQKVSMTGVKSYESTVKFTIRAIDSTTAEVLFTQTFEKRGISVGDPAKALNEAVSKSLKDAVAALVKRLAPPTTD